MYNSNARDDRAFVNSECCKTDKRERDKIYNACSIGSKISFTPNGVRFYEENFFRYLD